jgi:hypothetical protein
MVIEIIIKSINKTFISSTKRQNKIEICEELRYQKKTGKLLRTEYRNLKQRIQAKHYALKT